MLISALRLSRCFLSPKPHIPINDFACEDLWDATGQYKRRQQLGGWRWPWQMGKDQASTRISHVRPQEAPGRGEATAPLHIPSGPNSSGERKTRESVPPTGQQGQDPLPGQGPGQISQGQPGLGEGQQASRPFALLTLGRVCGAFLSLETDPSLLLLRPCPPGQSACSRGLNVHPAKEASQNTLSLP